MNRQKKNQKNPWIFCECGCGKKRRKFDSQGRERKIISGHSYIRTKKHRKKLSQLKKGKKVHTPHSKKLLSLAAKGRKLSEEHKKNIARGLKKSGKAYHFKKGHKPWNKGKKGLVTQSQETKDKIIESRKWYKGSKKAQETGKKVSKAKKGIPMPKHQLHAMNEKKRKENEMELKRSKKLLKKVKNNEMINGLLLSDATLRRVEKNQNSDFAVSQTGERRKFLYVIQEHLKKLGFSTRINKNRHKIHKTWQYKIETRKHVVWTELRKLWYPDGYKIVPNSLKLTPKTLAWLYMGDGSADPKGGKSVEKYDITLATQGFKKEYTELIIRKLHDLGLTNARTMKRQLTLPPKGRGFAIIISKAQQVEEFMQLVEQFIILPTFRKKIRHPLIMTPEIKAERARKRAFDGKEETILAITAYRNYEKTDMTRSQIFDAIAQDLGLTKKERRRLGGKLHNYLAENPDEKNRPRLNEKIIESYMSYENSGMPCSKIYDRMQVELKIPTEHRHAMRNVVSEYRKLGKI